MRRQQCRGALSRGRRWRLLPLRRFVAQRLAVLQDLRHRPRPCVNVADLDSPRVNAGARRESFRSRRVAGDRQSILQTLWGGLEAIFALLRNLRQYARPLERSPSKGTGRRRTGSRGDYWKAGRAGRKTGVIKDSLTTDFRAATGPIPGRPANPNSETKKRTFEGPISGGRTEQLVQRSDSRGAILVWIIIATLAVAAGIVAWWLWTSQKNLMRRTGQSAQQSPQPTTGLLGATPQVSPIPKQTVAPDGMVFVPGGTFKMGRDDGDELERPAHIVEVRPFFIDRNEVTNEEYQRFISATKRRAPAHWVGGKIPNGQMKFPIVNVSWDDANAYAR